MGRISRVAGALSLTCGIRLEVAVASTGLQQSFGRLAFKVGTVSYFASAIIG